MKKLMNWMIAAILLCGTSVMTSCFIDDNPVDIPEIYAKCASYSVSFKFEAPVANNAFFQTRYAWWNGETKHGPLTAYGNFISQTYPSKDDLTFPAQEAFFLHYKVKDVAILPPASSVKARRSLKTTRSSRASSNWAYR